MPSPPHPEQAERQTHGGGGEGAGETTPCRHGTDDAGQDPSICSACVHEACRHRWWEPVALLGALVVVAPAMLARSWGRRLATAVRVRWGRAVSGGIR